MRRAHRHRNQHSRKAQKLCKVCGKHKAVSRSPNHGFTWLPDHDLCPRCWQAEKDRLQGEKACRGRSVFHVDETLRRVA